MRRNFLVKIVLDDMPINDAIEIYYEKHSALRDGNISKLISLKKKCPDIFDKEKDDQLRDMIQYAQEFQASPRYRELWRQEMREKLSVIKRDPCE